MVATTSHFTVRELLESGHEEDAQVARKCADVVTEILADLKPVLKYLVAPITLASVSRESCPHYGGNGPVPSASNRPKAITMPNFTLGMSQLFLAEDGTFFIAAICDAGAGTAAHYHDSVSSKVVAFYGGKCVFTWESFFFQAVLHALRDILADAKQKREQHLATITSRLAMLDRIVEVIADVKAGR